MNLSINKFTLALGALLVSGGAMAATAVGTLTATATVLSSCTIGSAVVAFGNYDPVNVTNTDAATTVDVLCTSGTTYSIYSTTPLADRVMITGAGGAGQELTFGVYGSTIDRTAETQLPLTNTTGNISGTGTGLVQSVDLFGRVAALQNVVPGIYTNVAALTNLTIEY